MCSLRETPSLQPTGWKKVLWAPIGALCRPWKGFFSNNVFLIVMLITVVGLYVSVPVCVCVCVCVCLCLCVCLCVQEFAYTAASPSSWTRRIMPYTTHHTAFPGANVHTDAQ